MSSDDGQDRPPPTSKSSGALNIFRGLSTSRPKPLSTAGQGDGSSEQLLPGRLSRTRSRGPGGGGEGATRTSNVTIVSAQQGEQPSIDAILREATIQNTESVRQSAVKWADDLAGEMTQDQLFEIIGTTQDLLVNKTPSETRHSIYSILEKLLKQQNLSLSQDQQMVLFDVISKPTPPEDLAAKLDCLEALESARKRRGLEPLQILPLLSGWIDPWFVDAAAKKKSKSAAKSGRSGTTTRDSQSSSGKSDDEQVFYSRLGTFACRILKDEEQLASKETLAQLLDEIVGVCRKTTAEADIKTSLAVFDAVLPRSPIPDKSLGACIDVLCGTYASVGSLADDSWNSIQDLLQSPNQDAAMQKMYHSLESGADGNLNIIRGTVNVFNRLVFNRDVKLPVPDFVTMIKSLNLSLAKDSAKLEGDTLSLCSNYLEGYVNEVTQQGDWTEFFEVIRKCSKRMFSTEKGDNERGTPISGRAVRQSDLDNIEGGSVSISRSLRTAWKLLNRSQKALAAAYLTRIYRVLDEPQLQLLREYYDTEALDTQHEQWLEHARHLINTVYGNKDNSIESRLFAISVVQKAYLNGNSSTRSKVHKILHSMFASLKTESNPAIYDATIEFLVNAADINDTTQFETLLKSLLSCTTKSKESRKMSYASLTSGSSPAINDIPILLSAATDSPLSNVTAEPDTAVCEPKSSLQEAVAKGLVQIGLRALNTSAMRSALTFDYVLDLARSETASTDARMTALKFLFRVRSDTNGALYVISESESEHVAAALCRTIESDGPAFRRDDRTPDRATPEDGASNQGLRLSISLPQSGVSRSGTRGASSARPVNRVPPMWTQSGPIALPEDPPSVPSQIVFSSFFFTPEMADDGSEAGRMVLKVNQWLELVIELLQRKNEDWEVYSYVIVHLGSQLMNTCHFEGCIPQIKLLRNVLCDQVIHSKFIEPPKYTGLRKSDVAVCVFHALSVLVTYHKHFSKGEQDELVRSLTQGIDSGGGSSRTCIHALSISCHEIPLSVTRILQAILEKMSTIITQSHLAVHILEFLAELARLPDVYINLRDELRYVFGVCARYLQTAREHRRGTGATSNVRASYASRHSGSVRDFSAVGESSDPSGANDLPQYVYALTYHVMIFWFLSLKLHDRAHHVKWIMRNLVFKDESGKDTLEEQSEVFIDMMQRTAYSDLGDTLYKPDFAKPSDGKVQKKSWLVGLSILTVETASATGLTQITKRQASGTTHSVYQQVTADPLLHHIPVAVPSRAGTEEPVSMLPSHILLQLTTSAFPTYVEMQPIPLPSDDEAMNRAIRTFDRNDIVDGHKVGIVYVGEGQTGEIEILANTYGSDDYNDFLEGLGTKVPLEGVKFNKQGLEPNIDGTHTYAWRDRVTEIIFHTATMMPTNLEVDPICAQKKRHIGNDFVTIVFNESNLPFQFDTIPSQFNYVNIVITPASRLSKPLGPSPPRPYSVDPTTQSHSSFFKVQVISKPGFPSISPASDPKLLSKTSLPAFVRLISLNASVFSLVYSKRNEKEDHISSWLNRLRTIRELRKRMLEKMIKEAAETASGGGGRNDSPASKRTSAYPEGENTRMKALAARAGIPDVDNLVDVMDFSGWTD
jgi:hypothetical protein